MMETAKIDYQNILQAFFEDYMDVDSQRLKDYKFRLFKKEASEFLLVAMGWLKKRYVHHVVFHVEVIGEMIWIHQNNTDTPLERELSKMGIPLSVFRVTRFERSAAELKL